MKLLYFAVLSTFITYAFSINDPEQVHLSLTGNMDEMMVTWLTFEPLPNVTPFVSYGLEVNNSKLTSKANTTRWVDEGVGFSVRYTHRAVMKNLLPGVVYYYSVGSEQASSKVFSFTQPDPSKPLRAAIFGDLSIKQGYSIEPLINATLAGEIIVQPYSQSYWNSTSGRRRQGAHHHIPPSDIISIEQSRDIAYDLHDDEGKVGDEFMRYIEPMAAHIPYMVFAGNHEFAQKFNHIINRFSMPKNGVYDNNLFWSFDWGISHFIGLNTEYYAELMPEEANAQYKWLKEDLTNNTAKWTFVLFHRPMYCSTKSDKGCHDEKDIVTRKGDDVFPGWEKLLKKHNVDLVLYGHRHTYERMWPIYKGKPFVSSDPSHIKNPEAPVYILTGAAGCEEHHKYPNDSIPQPFSVTRLGNYGYAILDVFNSSHISTHFVDTSDNVGALLDEMYIEKD